MTAKEKAIREAWGDKFKELKDYIDENGWIERRITGHGETNGLEHDNHGYSIEDIAFKRLDSCGNYLWRPKQLVGIDNNNGWLPIENFNPKQQEGAAYWMMTKKGKIINTPFRYNEWTNKFDSLIGGVDIELFSHYIPIQLPKDKIY